jgi:cell wall-associated NlpC family hydrolase
VPAPTTAPTTSTSTSTAPTSKASAAPPSSASLATPPTLDASLDDGERVARIAERFLREHRRLRREDCSGFVEDVLRAAGVVRRGGARAMWTNAVEEGRVAHDSIRPGDLVFFDRTWDSNHNGLVDDTLTHVAIAVRMLDDGTVVMIHRSVDRIEELRMNLREPDAYERRGHVVNSYLRAPRYGGARSPRLSGELYHGHVRPPAAPR